MPDEEDWLMRPVLRGMCRYESLIDGSISLSDIARMNDAISVQDENVRRIRAAQAEQRQQ
jgi:hypothetical protein